MTLRSPSPHSVRRGLTLGIRVGLENEDYKNIEDISGAIIVHAICLAPTLVSKIIACANYSNIQPIEFEVLNLKNVP